MYVYKISYSDYDEYDYDYLKHEKQFSNDELRMMVYNCIKELVKNKEYDTPPCLLSVGDFFNDYNQKYTIAQKMVDKYGFKFFRFQASVNLNNFKIFKKNGFSQIQDITDIECPNDECTFAEHSSFNSNRCPCREDFWVDKTEEKKIK